MDRTGGRLDETSGAGTSAAAVHALFQQRIAGDDALLKLAGLRFAQMGVAAETYADTPDQLDHVLRFVPAHARLPVVHLNRGIDVLHERGRSAVREFADRFAGRVGGIVVHDHRAMGEQTDRLLAGMRELDTHLRERPGGPVVFLEYAAGLDLSWFVEVAEQLQDAERVSFCVDVGHVGIKQASHRFWLRHPGLGLGYLTTADYRLPDLVADVQDAVAGALPDVLDLIRALGALGKQLHFHLHDGHPLIPGLKDHFSFLMRVPIPFTYQGRQSLRTLYGPDGLTAIVSAAIEALPAQAASFTLEIHQVEGRLPLTDAAWLFRHWRDVTNAERMNFWLSVLSDNAMLMPGHAAEPAVQGSPCKDQSAAGRAFPAPELPCRAAPGTSAVALERLRMTIFYPDVASYQAGINFAGCVIAMVKATESDNYTNPDYAPAKGRAASAGAYFCAYHFLHSGNGAGQASHAFSVVGRGVPLMIDCEPTYNPDGTIASAPQVSDASDFIREYRALGGTAYLLYLPHWYWAGNLGQASLASVIGLGMLLVSSEYTGYSDTGPGWAPYGGMTPVVWQYTSSASLNGVGNVDMNAYRGTLADFQAQVTTGALGTGGGQGEPTLVEGDAGPAVQTLQTRLNVWGAHLAVDGDFGPLTLAAVKAFQTQHNLTVDGIVGPQTWAALNANPAGVPYPAPTGLAAGLVSQAVHWDEVIVKGQPVASYTVEAVGLNGEVYAHETPATNSVVLTGLVHGWTYNILVWANGGPVAPPHASIKVTV
jgi:GH25 family lysozyme M1 (1,4-beta-N-acetylmuramidase)